MMIILSSLQGNNLHHFSLLLQHIRRFCSKVGSIDLIRQATISLAAKTNEAKEVYQSKSAANFDDPIFGSFKTQGIQNVLFILVRKTKLLLQLISQPNQSHSGIFHVINAVISAQKWVTHYPHAVS